MELLIVVDMQNDFIDGSLGTPEARKIVPNVVEKIKSVTGSDVVVMATKDTHQSNYFQTREGHALPVAHCIEGTAGWSINDQVSSALKTPGLRLLSLPDVVAGRINKVTFGSIEMMKHVQELSQQHTITKVTLIGLCTDICVISNAMLMQTALPEAQIVVDAKCCAGVTPESHLTALSAMRSCQIEIIND